MVGLQTFPKIQQQQIFLQWKIKIKFEMVTYIIQTNIIIMIRIIQIPVWLWNFITAKSDSPDNETPVTL